MDPDRKPLDVEPAAAGPQSAAEPAGPDADATASAVRSSGRPWIESGMPPKPIALTSMPPLPIRLRMRSQSTLCAFERAT